MRLALGPTLYYWPKETLLAFYDDVAKADVDIVYIGEAVCARRWQMRFGDWLEVGEKLVAAGKEVVFSSQVLIESEADLKNLRRLADNGRFRIEANDFGALRLLAGKAQFVAGPHLNVYNAPTLQMLAESGATRWVMPIEMSGAQLMALTSRLTLPIETEVFALGRMPLAFSARCFTARHYNLQKDDCQFKCIEYPDGLKLATREGEGFLVLNGIQTQSSRVYNLSADLAALASAGVDVLRVSPQAQHTIAVLALMRELLAGPEASSETLGELARLLPDESCDGYWHGRPGLDQVRCYTN